MSCIINFFFYQFFYITYFLKYFFYYEIKFMFKKENYYKFIIVK